MTIRIDDSIAAEERHESGNGKKSATRPERETLPHELSAQLRTGRLGTRLSGCEELELPSPS
jgi:hypothetical protein